MSIKIQNLEYIYNSKTVFESTALNNINCEIQNGEFIGIIGHTGSGKSTLIQQLNGLLKPTNGTIFIDDLIINKETKKFLDIRKKVGVSFQYADYQLFEDTVENDISYGPKNLGYSDIEISKMVSDIIKIMGLNEDILKKSPFELSGGQKKIVAIAGILVMKPDVLVLDEPTVGLDPKSKKEVLDVIYRYHMSKKENITILVSHSMEDIFYYADKILVLEKGKIKFFDDKSEIYDKIDELKKIGLDIPEITKIILELNKSGFKIDKSISDIDLLVEEILK